MSKIFPWIIAVLLVLPACTHDSPSNPASLAAWIDAPLQDSTIPLAPYEIVAHGSDPEQIKSLEISVDGKVLGTIENQDPDDLLLSAKLAWTPPSPGTYTIQARSQNGGGEWSNAVRVQVTVRDELLAQPALELLPTGTATLAEVACQPEITAIMNTTCRQGPSTYHEPSAYILEDESASILGANQDQSWWAVLPETQTSPCWVAGGTVEVSCLPEEPEILDSPPYITRVFPSLDEFYWGDNPQRSVIIQAQCGGETPITTVRLFYHLAGKADWYNTAMVPNGSGIWQAQINAHTFAGYSTVDSVVVEYYLQATNQAGLAAKSALFTNLRLKEVP